MPNNAEVRQQKYREMLREQALRAGLFGDTQSDSDQLDLSTLPLPGKKRRRGPRRKQMTMNDRLGREDSMSDRVGRAETMTSRVGRGDGMKKRVGRGETMQFRVGRSGEPE